MKVNKYSELPLWEKFISKIMVYYQTVWAEKKFNASNHKKWLANFEDAEQLNSLYLLSKVMFFGQDEIRELLVSIYRDKFKYSVVSKIRKDNHDTKDIDFINARFESQQNITRFVGLGGSSESGSYLLMLYRQVNKLPTRLMKNSSELLNNGMLAEPNVSTYIFIDDFCGSGETAIKYSDMIRKLKHVNPSIQVYYHVLFATETGFRNVVDNSVFDRVETVFKLDETFKCFNDDSRYFCEDYVDINKDFSKIYSKKYGTEIVTDTPVEGHPLGFDDGQLLLAFAHNTPDNSLPIIWGSNNWEPFFIRYIKII